jgi:AraC family transcriptional activator of tynA and feaB
MAMNATPGVLTRGTTRGLPSGRDYEYFCDAVADLYVGVRPDKPDGRFPADFALYQLDEGTSLGELRTRGTPAARDRGSLSRLPDDSFYLNFSRASWTVEHLGRTWDIPAGVPFLLDNAAAYRLQFDPRRPMHLYSLRVPRISLPIPDVCITDRALLRSPVGRLVSAQTSLMAATVDSGDLRSAAAMSSAIVRLLSGDSLHLGIPSVERVTALKAAARPHLDDPSYGIEDLARSFHCSIRTVQNAFASRGERFSEWLSTERLERSYERLSSEDWAGHSVASIAKASGFADASNFHRSFRRRYGMTPGALR